MNISTKILFSISLFIFLVGTASAVQSCQTYDDFSSGTLDASKWTESIFHGDPFTDEHLIKNGFYHVAQNVARDAETNLAPTRQFIAGESFSYDVLYNGGSGNHQSQPLINGNYPPSQIETCNFTTAGCGAIGFMNAFPDLGAQIGIYHVKYEFFSNQVKMTAIRPDNVTIVNTFTGNSAPYTLTINTHTGHNGLMNFDYDNFVICSEQTPAPQNDLEARIAQLEEKIALLEEKVVELENKNSELENRTTSLESSLAGLKKSFDDFVKKFEKFIKKLPKGIRKYWN